MGFLQNIFGSKPSYKTPTKSAAEALKGNLANLPAAEELGSKVNTFNQDQLLAMLRKANPNFDTTLASQNDLLNQQLGVIQGQLKGEVPQSVADQLQLRDAAKAVRGGYAGSGAARNLEARDFGLTSLDITNRALQSASSWVDSASRWTSNTAALTQPAMFNVGSAFISPQQQFDFNKLVSENRAAPKPVIRGLWDTAQSQMGMAMGVYGGPGYQGTYHPASQGQYMAPQSFGGGAGFGASEGGGNIGSGWGGTYGESAGLGAFDF
jgi:hypothetical protein